MSDEADETKGCLAYYHAHDRRITLSRGLDPIAQQVNLAHEFTHAYRAQFNDDEVPWLSEGLAKYMEYKYVGAWPVSYHRRLRENPDLSFFTESGDFCADNHGYIPSFLLVAYLTNHFGGERLYKRLLESKLSGWESILGAINSLQREGVIAIDESLITRPSILRHFAVALWINDPFAAKYALFQVDTRFEALSSESSLSGPLRLGEPGNTRREFVKGESRILFTQSGPMPGASEAWAVRSRKPLVIESVRQEGAAQVSPDKNAEVYISIFY